MTNLAGYFGHHKCASSWLHKMIGEACRDMGIRHRKVSNATQFNGDLEAYVKKNKLAVVSYTNADYSFVKSVSNLVGVHVVRDPRDVVVSGYFSHRNSHPTYDWKELAPHRERLQALPFHEGLLEEFSFSKRFLDEMDGWDYSRPGILHLKMEDLTANPYEGFLQILRHLQLLQDKSFRAPEQFKYSAYAFSNRLLEKARLQSFPPLKHRITPERALGIAHNNSFKFLAGGRSAGTEDASSHYRKGTPGDWANHFSDEHVAAFKSMYGDLLIKLGYESGTDWSRPTLPPSAS